MADHNSYGFRPERSTADARAKCFDALAKEKSPQWILEGDIKGCFDNINHEWLLENVPTDKAIPVSYTHLDVYKRQPEDRVEAYAWLGLAAEQGERDALALQPGLQAELSDAELQQARQRAQRYRQGTL